MKVYKLEVVVIDFDEVGEEGIKHMLENVNFPKDCLSPHVRKIACAEIGEWSDDHPLKKRSTFDDEIDNLFNPCA